MKKNVKQLLALVLCGALMLSLAGCGGQSAPAPAAEPATEEAALLAQGENGAAGADGTAAGEAGADGMSGRRGNGRSRS